VMISPSAYSLRFSIGITSFLVGLCGRSTVKSLLFHSLGFGYGQVVRALG
jgi:hypothetical protein